MIKQFIKEYCQITKSDSKMHFSHFCNVFYRSLTPELKRKWNSQRIKEELPKETLVEKGWLKGIKWQPILYIKPISFKYTCKYCNNEPVEYEIKFWQLKLRTVNIKIMRLCGTCLEKKRKFLQ